MTTRTPATLDLTVYQTDTFDYTITVLQGDAGSDPVDLTGYTARMDMRAARDVNSTRYATLTTENGGITLGTDGDPTDGTVHLLLTDEQTAALTFEGRAYYDLHLMIGGRSDRYATGRVALAESATAAPS